MIYEVENWILLAYFHDTGITMVTCIQVTVFFNPFTSGISPLLSKACNTKEILGFS